MSPKLAPLFRSGVLPADSGDCPRDRLVLLRIDVDMHNGGALVKTYHRQWITEGGYRNLLRRNVRMVVLEER